MSGTGAAGGPGEAPPVLEVDSALAEGDRGAPADLRLAAGELVMVDAPDAGRASAFADLCSGLAPLAAGSVRFLGADWGREKPGRAAEMRGRIGRVFGGGRGWVPYHSVAENVLLPRLHHTRASEDDLRERAARLAVLFGLPGLPLGLPREQAAGDLARCACVRAFLGEPALLLLESPLLEGAVADLLPALLDQLAAARARGAACLWMTRSALVWSDRSIPAARRLRLSERGLETVRRATAAPTPAVAA